MTTIYTLQDADFSANALPSLVPFVANSALEFAYDFQDRPNRLKELTNTFGAAVPWKNDLKNAIRQIDGSVLVDVDDGAGITVANGFLDLKVPFRDTLLTDEFTVMFAGGYSGLSLPIEDKVGGDPLMCNLLDFGVTTYFQSFSLVAFYSSIGGRVKKSTPNISSTIPVSKKCVLFLTRKNGTWILDNKTMGVQVVKTDAELGVTGTLIPRRDILETVNTGHVSKTTTYEAMYPTLYQCARWTRPLTGAEIDAQYLATKQSKPAVTL